MVFFPDSSVLSQIFQMVFFPDSSKSNLLCCCNRFHVLSQIFQKVFFPDSSESNLLCCCNRFPVFSQIFQMGFFSDFCVVTDIPDGIYSRLYAAVTDFLCWNRYSIWYFFQTLLCCHRYSRWYFFQTPKSNLLCCCNRFHLLSQIFQMGFFPDSSVLSQIFQIPDGIFSRLCCCNRFPVFSQIFQMGFFSDFCVVTDIPDGIYSRLYAAVTDFLCWNRYSILYFFQTLLCCHTYS